MSRKSIYFILIPLTLGILSIAILAYQYYLTVYCPTNSQSIENVVLTINPGESGLQVINKLYQQHLIHSVPLAQVYARLQQINKRQIQAGEYTLSPSLNLIQMYDLFQHGTFDITITIPEGKRLEEIAELISKNLNITPDEFISAAIDKRGYLFPDTYQVPGTISVHDLVLFMRENFDRKVEVLQNKFQEQGLSLREAVTIASIVEREARFDQDRPVIAGILIKRYQNDWLLEADATVQFAKGSLECNLQSPCQWWPSALSAIDLKLESPYNTRTHDGLPPTPICSPGLESLTAVAQPAETPYWFYLSDSQGETYYSTSYEEHLLNVNKHLYR